MLSVPAGAPTTPSSPKICIGGVTDESTPGTWLRQKNSPAWVYCTLGSSGKQLPGLCTGWTLDPVGPTAVTRNTPPPFGLTYLCEVVVATSVYGVGSQHCVCSLKLQLPSVTSIV